MGEEENTEACSVFTIPGCSEIMILLGKETIDYIAGRMREYTGQVSVHMY